MDLNDRRAFTMLELIFVIIILGVLAAVALPRLAATRDDARAAGLKSDIGTISSAVPAWYTGQNEVSISNALSINTAVWTQRNGFADYTWMDSSKTACVQVRIVDANITDVFNADITDPSQPTAFTNTAQNGGAVLQIRDVRIPPAVGDFVCRTLWDPNQLALKEMNISMAGQVVKWQ